LGLLVGDIRPSPILMPCPFSGRSRARSHWIDTGASQRRPLTAEDDLPRGIVVGGTTIVGPKFEFAGLNNAASVPGYVDYQTLGTTGVKINYPLVISPIAISSKTSDASYLGKPAYKLTLASAGLGEDNRYVQYEAELLNASGAALTSFRIVNHIGTDVLLDPGVEPLPNDAAQMQVRAKFFKIVTRNSEGLGPVYTPIIGGVPTAVPIASVRFGFAFHRDPNPTNILLGRFPGDNPGLPGPLNNATENDFISDLDMQALQDWINAPLAQGGCGGRMPRYIQWDVTFDMAYDPAGANAGQSLTPTTPRPELHFLRIPFRF
jgi:hypothetical protein